VGIEDVGRQRNGIGVHRGEHRSRKRRRVVEFSQ
jgi:hypothetical protein